MRRLLVLLKNMLSIPFRVLSHVSIFAILQEAHIDKTAAVCSGVRFYRGKIGRYSYIGNNSFVIDTNIGSFTSIGNLCSIGGTAHPLSWVSTSPVFHKWSNILRKNFASHEFPIFKKSMIGNDVWIGDRTMIKAGVTIGDGAVIGMGSVVTKDIGDYEIWVGNPARLVRKRFDDITISKLIVQKWWNWDEIMIKTYAPYMNEVDKFLEIVEESVK